MINTPLTLSLVIPVYNEESYLKACLESVAAQTVKPFEVIVVDNNSTDKTAKIARSYSFVKLVNEKQQGVLHARTRGFNLARGDLIGRIDADTVLMPNWTAYAIRAFTNDRTMAALTGSGHWYDMPLKNRTHLLEHSFKGLLYRLDHKYPFLYGTNMIMTKKDWQKVKKDLCTQKYIFEDIDLGIHLYQNGQKVIYDRHLRVGMSSRRYYDRFTDFWHYIKLNNLTYRYHGLRSFGQYYAIMGYVSGYFILWPFSRSYDQSLGKHTFKRLITGGNKARVHPMG